MRIKLDRQADALYVRLTDADIVESEEVAPGVIIDYDQNGVVVGVEILQLGSRHGQEAVASIQVDTD
ncbi:MAG: DUF2283 domain-containing protein [Firmicutes bacterium]|nr:DUF2283 domain-containing protein [Bacillota bacterium]